MILNEFQLYKQSIPEILSKLGWIIYEFNQSEDIESWFDHIYAPVKELEINKCYSIFPKGTKDKTAKAYIFLDEHKIFNKVEKLLGFETRENNIIFSHFENNISCSYIELKKIFEIEFPDITALIEEFKFCYK